MRESEERRAGYGRAEGFRERSRVVREVREERKRVVRSVGS